MTDTVIAFFESRGYTDEEVTVEEKLYNGRTDEWHDRVTVPLRE